MQVVFPRICRQLYADKTPADSHRREALQVQDMSTEVLTVGEFESAHARARTWQPVRMQAPNYKYSLVTDSSAISK